MAQNRFFGGLELRISVFSGDFGDIIFFVFCVYIFCPSGAKNRDSWLPARYFLASTRKGGRGQALLSRTTRNALHALSPRPWRRTPGIGGRVRGARVKVRKGRRSGKNRTRGWCVLITCSGRVCDAPEGFGALISPRSSIRLCCAGYLVSLAFVFCTCVAPLIRLDPPVSLCFGIFVRSLGSPIAADLVFPCCPAGRRLSPYWPLFALQSRSLANQRC